MKLILVSQGKEIQFIYNGLWIETLHQYGHDDYYSIKSCDYTGSVTLAEYKSKEEALKVLNEVLEVVINQTKEIEVYEFK